MRMLVLGALLGCMIAAEGAAQERRGIVEVGEREGRGGFWLGLGVGAGGETFNVAGDGFGYAEYLYRPTVSVKLGGTPGAHWRLGGELMAWINDEGHQTETLTSVLFIGQFYPISAAGLYLKGGLGVGRAEVRFDDGVGIGDTGFAGLLGAGYEVRLSRKVYLVPAVDLVQHNYESRRFDDYRERLVNFSLGVVVQTGL